MSYSAFHPAPLNDRIQVDNLAQCFNPLLLYLDDVAWHRDGRMCAGVCSKGSAAPVRTPPCLVQWYPKAENHLDMSFGWNAVLCHHGAQPIWARGQTVVARGKHSPLNVEVSANFCRAIKLPVVWVRDIFLRCLFQLLHNTFLIPFCFRICFLKFLHYGMTIYNSKHSSQVVDF